MTKKKVIIVGSGVAGLASALRLNHAGYEVVVIEKHHQAGGRLNRIVKDGFTFDTGPSFFSMSYEFRSFFKECGLDLPFEAIALDPLYTVHLAGSDTPYHLYKDIQKLSKQFEAVEPDFEKKMNHYLSKSGKLFHDTFNPVIRNNFDNLFQYVQKLARVNLIHVPVLTRTFWEEICRHFDSKEAREIISLVGFFLGRTPFDTMGIYSLLSYTEFVHDGYYNVKGGMYEIVHSMVKILEQRGVQIQYNTEIVSHTSTTNQLTAVIDQHGNEHTADHFIINSDAAAFRGKVFGRKSYSTKKLDKMSWTMGYLTIYLGINIKLKDINHHNYYLGSNYEQYKSDVKNHDLKGEKPYYYVNVLSKNNPDCAPEGCESLFFVCPVPNLNDKPNWDDQNEIVDSLIRDFSERNGIDIFPSIISKTVYTPLDWKSQFNLYHGSGLSLSPSMFQIGVFRPKNFDEVYSNTFYAGASTVPGSGIPMALISAELVCKRVYAFDNA
jgi:phytoene desaturase